MPDLDRLRIEELRRFGFLLVSGYEAKHMHHDSVRYKCDGCGLWCEQVYEKAGEMRCRECYRRPVTSS